MRDWSKGLDQVHFGRGIFLLLGNTREERIARIRQEIRLPTLVDGSSVYINIDDPKMALQDWEVVFFSSLEKTQLHCLNVQEALESINTLCDGLQNTNDGLFAEWDKDVKQGGAQAQSTIANDLLDLAHATIENDDSALMPKLAKRHLSYVFRFATTYGLAVPAALAITEYLALHLETEGSDLYAMELLFAAKQLFGFASQTGKWTNKEERAQISYNLGVAASKLGEDFDEVAILKTSKWFSSQSIQYSEENVDIRIAALFSSADACVNLGEYDVAMECLEIAEELIQIGGITPAERYMLNDINQLRHDIQHRFSQTGNCDCGDSGRVPAQAKEGYGFFKNNLGKILWLGADLIVNGVASLFLRRPVKGIRLQVVFGRVIKGLQIGDRNRQVINYYQYNLGLTQSIESLWKRLAG